MALVGGETLLAFKAGRAFRREGTNIVEPSPVKGAIYITNGEDGLLHFVWKDRVTNNIEEVSPSIFLQTVVFHAFEILGPYTISFRRIVREGGSSDL